MPRTVPIALIPPINPPDPVSKAIRPFITETKFITPAIIDIINGTIFSAAKAPISEAPMASIIHLCSSKNENIADTALIINGSAVSISHFKNGSTIFSYKSAKKSPIASMIGDKDSIRFLIDTSNG